MASSEPKKKKTSAKQKYRALNDSHFRILLCSRQVDIFTIFGLFTSSIFGSCYRMTIKFPQIVIHSVCVRWLCGSSSAATISNFQTMPFHLCRSLLFMSRRNDVCVLHSRLLSGYEFNSIRSFRFVL